MKRLPYWYLVLFPWLELLAALTGGRFPYLALVLILALWGGSFCAAVAAALLSAIVTPPRSAARWNLGTKLSFLPVQLFLCLLSMGMMNPWLFVFLWMPLLIALFLTALSGGANVGACAGGFRAGRLGLPATVLLALLGFVPVLDLPAAIVETVLLWKDRTVSESASESAPE